MVFCRRALLRLRHAVQARTSTRLALLWGVVNLCVALTLLSLEQPQGGGATSEGDAAGKDSGHSLSYDQNKSRFITVTMFMGRMGNRLFQYASMYGLARRYNFEPVIANNWYLLRHVESQHLRARLMNESEWKQVQWRVWRETRACSYNRTEVELILPGSEHVLLETFMQSYQYFRGYEAEVVSQFVFKERERAWAQSVMDRVASFVPRGELTSTIVGMHVRRGDYLGAVEKRVGFRAPEPEYFIKAVQHFTSRYEFVAFVVCSDDIDWVGNFFTAYVARNERARRATYFEFIRGDPMYPEKDMALLSSTDHSILSAGTFSFWSAMLRQYRSGKKDNGTTIYYNKPFYPNTEMAEHYDNSIQDFFPPDWIGLD